MSLKGLRPKDEVEVQPAWTGHVEAEVEDKVEAQSTKQELS